MNHIENIEIKNFKSIRHQKIEGCKRINVFVGPPNVGKSNILEALGLFGVYNPVDIGNTHFVNKADIDNIATICRIKKDYELFFNQNTQERVAVIINTNFAIDISSTELGLLIKLGLLKVMSNKRVLSTTKLKYLVKEDFDFALSKEGSNEIPINFPKFHIKKYHFTDTSILTAKGSLSLHFPEGENLLNVLQANPALRKELVELFRMYNLRFAIENSSQSIRLLKEMKEDSIVIIPYYQIADTLRRLVFFKTAIFSNSNAILLFEEPEAHMFPPYISKLTSDIVNDENNNQFFLATHSPFVMNDLISNVEKDELSIYIVSYENETGETVIHRMSDKDVNEAYQFGYDFFMNIDNFIPQKQHD